MRTELEMKLWGSFPVMFRGRHKTLKETAMCWGCECGDGWYWLLHCTLALIAIWCFLSGCEQPELTQIKEKYGRLRIYFWTSDLVIDYIVNAAEYLSGYICEECGWPGNIDYGKFWLEARCGKHKRNS